MEEAAERLPWLTRGRQRRAVANALRKPMRAGEIWLHARAHAADIQLRDVWRLLNHLQERELVTCLTDDRGNGALYYWTEYGRRILNATLSLSLAPLPSAFSWNQCAFVMRGAVRRAVVKELSRPVYAMASGKTASELRKRMLDTFPVSLNALLRTLNELRGEKIVQSNLNDCGKRTYKLTASGRKIAELLNTDSFVCNAF